MYRSDLSACVLIDQFDHQRNNEINTAMANLCTWEITPPQSHCPDSNHWSTLCFKTTQLLFCKACFLDCSKWHYLKNTIVIIVTSQVLVASTNMINSCLQKHGEYYVKRPTSAFIGNNTSWNHHLPKLITDADCVRETPVYWQKCKSRRKYLSHECGTNLRITEKD